VITTVRRGSAATESGANSAAVKRIRLIVRRIAHGRIPSACATERNPTEDVLQRELNRAIAALAGALPKRRTGRVSVRAARVRMVHDVEHLRPELEVLRLGNGKILAPAQIPFPETAMAQVVPRLLPESSRRGLRDAAWLNQTASLTSAVGRLDGKQFCRVSIINAAAWR
jgi:hypothetical protein